MIYVVPSFLQLTLLQMRRVLLLSLMMSVEAAMCRSASNDTISPSLCSKRTEEFTDRMIIQWGERLLQKRLWLTPVSKRLCICPLLG